MVEGVIAQLSRAWKAQTLPAFTRQSLLRYLPVEPIGDISVKEWAQKVLKTLGKAHMQKYDGSWGAPIDQFDLEDMRFELYDVQKRIKMNKAELAFFEKVGAMPAGSDQIATVMANKANYNLFRGTETGDQFQQLTAQYNYIIDTGSGSGSVSRPLPITNASAAVKWDAAGGAQKDAAKLAGSLRKLGKDPRMSIVLYPEVCSEVFARPIVTGSSIFSPQTIEQAFLAHGFIACIPVKDELLYTAGGATPTVEAFDIYALHIPDFRIGLMKDISTEVIPDIVSKEIYLDSQITFCPLKIPIKYDADGKYYSGVARVTACDANT